MWEAGAGQLIGANDVEVVDIEEILGRESIEVAMIGELRLAGIVDQEIDPAPPLGRSLGKRSRLGIVVEIGLDRERIGAITSK